MGFDDITLYRKNLYEHFNMGTFINPDGTGGALGGPFWASCLYNDLAKMHKDMVK